MTAQLTHRHTVKTGVRAVCVAVAAVLLAAAGLIVNADVARGASTSFPSQVDPNSVGGITFFNASGKQVTSGSLSAHPFVAYAEGTKTIRSGDTKATLYGELPVSGTASGTWTSAGAFGGPTTYPNKAAPGALGTTKLPLLTGAASDQPLSNLVADDGRPSSDAYSGIYQLRLETTQAQQASNTTYDSADISVDTAAGTWKVVYDKLSLKSTTTSLTVSKKGSVTYGTKITLTAKVKPTTLAGTVAFRDGKTVRAKVKVHNGVATYTTKSLSDGKHTLTAVFTPSSSATYGSSTSSTHTLTVRAHATKVALTVSAKSIAHGKKLTLTAEASPAKGGKVTFTSDGKTLKAVSVSKSGKATFSTSGLAVGKHKLQAHYKPSNAKAYATSVSSVVKVTVKK